MLRLILLYLLSSSTATYAFIPNIQLNKLKIVKLILWTCGDIELNPGPRNARSEVLRRFRKTQQTPILLQIYTAKGLNSPKALYTRDRTIMSPSWWDECSPEVPFVNISNHKNEEESIRCFQKMIEIIHALPNVPEDLKIVLTSYEELKQKSREKEYLQKCKDDLINWMDRAMIEKTQQNVKNPLSDDALRVMLQSTLEQIKNGREVAPDIADMCMQIVESSIGSRSVRLFFCRLAYKFHL